MTKLHTLERAPRRDRSGRSLAGLEAEYRVALAERKPWAVRKLREAARQLCERTGALTPAWAQGFEPVL